MKSCLRWSWTSRRTKAKSLILCSPKPAFFCYWTLRTKKSKSPKCETNVHKINLKNLVWKKSSISPVPGPSIKGPVFGLSHCSGSGWIGIGRTWSPVVHYLKILDTYFIFWMLCYSPYKHSWINFWTHAALITTHHLPFLLHFKCVQVFFVVGENQYIYRERKLLHFLISFCKGNMYHRIDLKK